MWWMGFEKLQYNQFLTENIFCLDKKSLFKIRPCVDIVFLLFIIALFSANLIFFLLCQKYLTLLLFAYFCANSVFTDLKHIFMQI